MFFVSPKFTISPIMFSFVFKHLKLCTVYIFVGVFIYEEKKNKNKKIVETAERTKVGAYIDNNNLISSMTLP